LVPTTIVIILAEHAERAAKPARLERGELKKVWEVWKTAVLLGFLRF
jgi:hypothetical protein